MEQKINAIIIDDEARARSVLSSLIKEYCKNINIVAMADNVPAGVLAINKHKPDVLFLDIEMPNYSGFELLGFFREVDFEIIFVTAYNQYAVDAFKVSAVDYLLKPVRVDLLEEAVQKLITKLTNASMFDRLNILKSNLENNELHKIAVPVLDGLIFIKIDEISYIEADGSYAKLNLIDGSKMVVSRNLKYFADALNSVGSFYRVHRSFLVNIKNIRKYNRRESTILLENNHVINVARDSKTKFEELLKSAKT